jgi:hypothetical protein
MSVSPPSGSASAARMQLRTLCLSAGLRLSDRVEPDAYHLSRSWTVDLCPQRPTNATSFRGSIQTLAARVQVDAATGLGLCRIDHADPVPGDDPQQVGLVCSSPAARAHSYRSSHGWSGPGSDVQRARPPACGLVRRNEGENARIRSQMWPCAEKRGGNGHGRPLSSGLRQGRVPCRTGCRSASRSAAPQAGRSGPPGRWRARAGSRVRRPGRRAGWRRPL